MAHIERTGNYVMWVHYGELEKDGKSTCVWQNGFDKKRWEVKIYGHLAVLQPLRWRCVDCVIHHERDVLEE